jgi:hypothetical protein
MPASVGLERPGILQLEYSSPTAREPWSGETCQRGHFELPVLPDVTGSFLWLAS